MATLFCSAVNIWEESNFPRIIEDLPRRLPRPDVPRIVEGVGTELRGFLFSPTPQGSLPWKTLIGFCIALALLIEIWNISSRTARSLQKKSGSIFTPAEFKEPKNQNLDELELGPELPDVPKTEQGRERLKADREAYLKEIRAERSRGLLWLAVLTMGCIWCTGILQKDNALQP